MNAPTATGFWPVDIDAYGGWLFDLDGVLTRTAEVHAVAWKQAFDEFLDIGASEQAERSRRSTRWLIAGATSVANLVRTAYAPSWPPVTSSSPKDPTVTGRMPAPHRAR